VNAAEKSDLFKSWRLAWQNILWTRPHDICVGVSVEERLHPLEPADSSVTRFWEKISLIAEISAACRRLDSEAPAFDEVLGLIQGLFLSMPLHCICARPNGALRTQGCT